MEKDLIEDRAHYLDLFMKQLVRCPYLYESQEFKIFIRPQIELEKALNLLPRLTYEQVLNNISKYYSFMGDVTKTQISKYPPLASLTPDA